MEGNFKVSPREINKYQMTTTTEPLQYFHFFGNSYSAAELFSSSRQFQLLSAFITIITTKEKTEVPYYCF